MKILTYIQSQNNKINNCSLEALVGAQQIAKKNNGNLIIVTFNQDCLETLQNYYAEKIIYSSSEKLKNFHPLIYTNKMEQIINAEKPDLIIFGHTYEARDWVPRLSARLNIPFLSDCVGLSENENMIRPFFQGKINVEITCPKTYIASFQSGVFKTENIKSGNAKSEELDNNQELIDESIILEPPFKESKSAVDLSQAKLIVSVGRGIDKEENIDLIKKLAEALGAEVGSSRPIVDHGWLEHDRQIGSSGQIVSPKLYFAIGLSGSVQHQVGMKSSENIFVINKDKNAPIFEIADKGAVADLFDIVPKLTEIINNQS